ncbi:hypothetical protein ACJJWD_09565 [Comamonas testosteroni]|uniref:phage head spike fiber domain-containing protein n=1 Tax=Comamonas testosteroni TaxID=285 RepID=UPI003899D39A
MSVIADLPDIRPSLLLDFANSRRVHPLIQCVRASTATCFGSDGKLRTVAANVPRVEFDSMSGKCLGFLIEEARTNLITFSQTLGNAAWAKSANAVVTEDNAVAPDGTSTADTVVSSGGAVSTNRIQQFTNYAVTVGVVATFSVWLRADAPFTSGLRLANQGDGDGVNQSVDVTTAWQRFSITQTFTGASTQIRCCIASSSNNGTLQAWGAQLEIGAFPSSYIPTTSAAVTRAADLIDLDYTLPAVGAVVSAVAGISSASTSNAYVWSAINPADNSADHAYFYYPGGTQSTNWWVNKGGVGQSGGNVLGRRQSAGFNFDASVKSAAIASGSLLFEDTTRPRDFPSNLSRLMLGRSRANAGFLNGCISRLAVYSSRITNAQLQRLTA